MPEATNMGILSLVPLTITLVLAFWKKMLYLHYLLDAFLE